MTTTRATDVTHTGQNAEGSADRLEIRTATWEATGWVSFGLWPSVELRRFAHTCGGETPTAAERGRIRRAALKWAKENR